MAINAPSKQELDSLIRQTLVSLKTSFDNLKEVKDYLDAVPDADLLASGGGYEYTQEELTNLRSSLADLEHLRLVATGQATQSGQSDFFTFPRRIWGINLIRR